MRDLSSHYDKIKIPFIPVIKKTKKTPKKSLARKKPVSTVKK